MASGRRRKLPVMPGAVHDVEVDDRFIGAGYDYNPGYYAVFVRDPDGFKLEVVHIPEEIWPGPERRGRRSPYIADPDEGGRLSIAPERTTPETDLAPVAPGRPVSGSCFARDKRQP
jgi:hypothetical protein